MELFLQKSNTLVLLSLSGMFIDFVFKCVMHISPALRQAFHRFLDEQVIHVGSLSLSLPVRPAGAKVPDPPEDPEGDV